VASTGLVQACGYEVEWLHFFVAVHDDLSSQSDVSIDLNHRGDSNNKTLGRQPHSYVNTVRYYLGTANSYFSIGRQNLPALAFVDVTPTQFNEVGALKLKS
jgi:hypothetical protein